MYYTNIAAGGSIVALIVELTNARGGCLSSTCKGIRIELITILIDAINQPV